MENASDQEKAKIVEGIKSKAQSLLSKVPEGEKPDKDVSLALQPVVPDPDKLIATADLVTIDQESIGSIITQTTNPNERKVFNHMFYLNHQGGPSTIRWETDLTSEGDIKEVEAEDIMDAMQSMRPASLPELTELDELLTRGQEKGFRVTFPGTHRRTT